MDALPNRPLNLHIRFTDCSQSQTVLDVARYLTLDLFFWLPRVKGSEHPCKVLGMELRHLGAAAWEDERRSWAKFPFHGSLPLWWWGRDENNQRNYDWQSDVGLVGPVGGGWSQDPSQLSVFCPASIAGCARTFGWKIEDPWSTKIFSTFDILCCNNLYYHPTVIPGIILVIETLVISTLASKSSGFPTLCSTTTAGRTSRSWRRRRRSLPATFGWLRLWKETMQVLSCRRPLLAKRRLRAKGVLELEEPELWLLQTGMVTNRHVLKPVWHLKPLQLMPLMPESSHLNVIRHMCLKDSNASQCKKTWTMMIGKNMYMNHYVSQVGLPSQDEQRGWIANCAGQRWQFLLGEQGQLKHHNFSAHGVVRV